MEEKIEFNTTQIIKFCCMVIKKKLEDFFNLKYAIGGYDYDKAPLVNLAYNSRIVDLSNLYERGESVSKEVTIYNLFISFGFGNPEENETNIDLNTLSEEEWSSIFENVRKFIKENFISKEELIANGEEISETAGKIVNGEEYDLFYPNKSNTQNKNCVIWVSKTRSDHPSIAILYSISDIQLKRIGIDKSIEPLNNTLDKLFEVL